MEYFQIEIFYGCTNGPDGDWKKNIILHIIFPHLRMTGTSNLKKLWNHVKTNNGFSEFHFNIKHESVLILMVNICGHMFLKVPKVSANIGYTLLDIFDYKWITKWWTKSETFDICKREARKPILYDRENGRNQLH